MILLKTVFVIGAGAGVDIAMPMGDQLSQIIGSRLDIRFEHGVRQISGDRLIMDALNHLARDDGSDANLYRSAGANVAKGIGFSRSIDSYLNAHDGDDHVKICAKLAIVRTILEAESKSWVFVDDQKRPTDFSNRNKVMLSWLNAFMYLLSEGIQKTKNMDAIFRNVSIVNFNYDRCIEQFLHLALQHLFVITNERAAELMRQLKIIHPYGVVGNLPWQEGLRVPFGVELHSTDLIAAAKGIRTFNEQIDDVALLRNLSEEISGARRIVFLGSHFHNQNMDLLRSSPPLRGSQVEVFGTAFNRSDADVTIIEGRIRDLLSPARGGMWKIAVRKGMDCAGLFKEYGTTLAG
jgi:hypothetical protein